jgi:hypothetical protein
MFSDPRLGSTSKWYDMSNILPTLSVLIIKKRARFWLDYDQGQWFDGDRQRETSSGICPKSSVEYVVFQCIAASVPATPEVLMCSMPFQYKAVGLSTRHAREAPAETCYRFCFQIRKRSNFGLTGCAWLQPESSSYGVEGLVFVQIKDEYV